MICTKPPSSCSMLIFRRVLHKFWCPFSQGSASHLQDLRSASTSRKPSRAMLVVASAKPQTAQKTLHTRGEYIVWRKFWVSMNLCIYIYVDILYQYYNMLYNWCSTPWLTGQHLTMTPQASGHRKNLPGLPWPSVISKMTCHWPVVG